MSLASPDLSVFQRIKAFPDYQKAEEEFQLAKQAKVMDNQAKQLNAIGQIIGGSSVDEQSYQRAKGFANSMGLDTSFLPNNFNPDVVNRLRFAGATPTAQLSALMQQQQMNLKAGNSVGDPTAFGWGSQGNSQINNNSPSQAAPIVSASKSAKHSNSNQKYTPQQQAEITDNIFNNPDQPTPYPKQPTETVEAYNARIKNDPQAQASIKGAEKRAETIAKAQGEEENLLRDMEASLPQLEDTVRHLSNLGKKATYTYAGQLRDFANRQLGGGATEGAQAREEYINTVKDVLYPQLRQTFGAQFTKSEGDALIGTLGDPNKSPEEKDSALRAFIQQKKMLIDTQTRRVGGEVKKPSSNNIHWDDLQ